MKRHSKSKRNKPVRIYIFAVKKQDAYFVFNVFLLYKRYKTNAMNNATTIFSAGQTLGTCLMTVGVVPGLDGVAGVIPATVKV